MLGELAGEVREAVGSRPGGGEPPGEGSAEPRHLFPVLLRTLGEALASDPLRLRLLVVEASHLPELADDELAGAWRGSLGERITGLLADCDGAAADDRRLVLASASVLEVIRSAVTVGEVEQLSARLEEMTPLLPGRAYDDPLPLLAA